MNEKPSRHHHKHAVRGVVCNYMHCGWKLVVGKTSGSFHCALWHLTHLRFTKSNMKVVVHCEQHYCLWTSTEDDFLFLLAFSFDEMKIE